MTTTTTKTKIIDFKKIFDDRDSLNLKIKKAGACKEEYKKLLKSTNEEEYIKIIQNNFNWFTEYVSHKFDYCTNFKNGVAKIVKGNKWGFLKSDGTMLTDIIYDYCYEFKGGFAIIEKDNKYGFLKSDGTMLTDIIFDECYNFKDGFALGKKYGCWGKLDTQGNFVYI